MYAEPVSGRRRKVGPVLRVVAAVLAAYAVRCHLIGAFAPVTTTTTTTPYRWMDSEHLLLVDRG